MRYLIVFAVIFITVTALYAAMQYNVDFFVPAPATTEQTAFINSLPPMSSVKNGRGTTYWYTTNDTSDVPALRIRADSAGVGVFVTADEVE